MKLTALCTLLVAAFFGSGNGETFSVDDCVLMDVQGIMTFTATDGQTELSWDFDVSEVPYTVSNTSCSVPGISTVSMTVQFNNSVTWLLLFTRTSDDVTQLDETITFIPSEVFNNENLPNELVVLADTGSLRLSSTNASFLCISPQQIPYDTVQEGDFTLGVTEAIRNLQVQAFNLEDNQFSPAEECDADFQISSSADISSVSGISTEPGITTEPSNITEPSGPTEPSITTEPSAPTEPPVPTPGPVDRVEFTLSDADGVVCFRLEAGLQFVVEYNTTDNAQAFSNVIPFTGDANVNGTCASGTENTATMVLTQGDAELRVVETRSDEEVSSAITLTVILNPDNFPDAAQANETVSFEMTGNSFAHNDDFTFYECDAEQTLTFTGTETRVFANDVQLQAFNLDNGDFTGDGERCGLDPTPEPPENKYVVEGNTNGTTFVCIVMTGDITLTNIPYNTTDNTDATADIAVPTLNATAGNVRVSGNCDLEQGAAQQLNITFNERWVLSLTFARGTQESSQLGATQDEYSLRDVELTYFWDPQYLPNAAASDEPRVASQMNITTDFLKGAAGGGSFRCDSSLTQDLNNGVQMETRDLEYKAFNTDLNENFNGDVARCSADDGSSSVVAIAVGASLGGLVVIILIAYLIGRRRKQRSGYETV